MRTNLSVIAGFSLALALVFPMSASAIVPGEEPEEPVVEEPPVPEVPVDEEDPVVENPDPDRPNGDREKPVKETKTTTKTVTKITRTKPEVKVYPYPTKKHYCAKGLQPVTVSGVVSCGRPTTRTTYTQMLAHPKAVKRKKVRHKTYHRSAVPTCRPGVKGCSD